KVITGDEDQYLIYTISTNGVVTPTDTTTLIPEAIRPEDFEIIPLNQDLYVCTFDYERSTIMKLSATYLTNCVGDLLITQAGEAFASPKLFIVHWNAGTTNFVTRRISYSGPHFEHVTFAPINLPPLTP
ncbi:MAG: hypothetical protein ACR2H1_12995, partial [Limisphaerales bacterium]